MESSSTTADHFEEGAVVYGMMCNPGRRVHEAVAILGYDGQKHFEDPFCAALFEGIVHLHIDEGLADFGVDEVRDWLKRSQGEPLTDNQASQFRLLVADHAPCSMEYWASRVLDASKRRRAAAYIRRFGLEFQEGQPTNDIINRAKEVIWELSDDTTHQPEPIADALGPWLNGLERQSEGEHVAHEVCSGYPSLDALIRRFGPGHVMIVAGRTGRGKTAMGLNMARHVAVEQHGHVLFLSLEMDRDELLNRLVSAHANTNMASIHEGFNSGPALNRVQHAAKRLEECRLYIDDRPPTNVKDLAARVASHVSLKGAPDLVIVDYLQLLRDAKRAENRQQEVSAISRQLKELAMRLKRPFLVLSQLRRPASDSEEDARPRLHHLRESGSIEQDADQVLLLYRKGVQTQRGVILECDLAKNRHGKVGHFQLEFVLETQRIFELGESAAAESESGEEDLF